MLMAYALITMFERRISPGRCLNQRAYEIDALKTTVVSFVEGPESSAASRAEDDRSRNPRHWMSAGSE